MVGIEEFSKSLGKLHAVSHKDQSIGSRSITPPPIPLAQDAKTAFEGSRRRRCSW
jgi:hypothetical protein